MFPGDCFIVFVQMKQSSTAIALAECTAKICDHGNACPVCNAPLDASNVSIATTGELSGHELDGMDAATILWVRTES